MPTVKKTQPPRIRSEVLMKKILRGFRNFLKNRFKALHQKRYYYVIESTLRSQTKVFFTTAPFNFSDSEYSRDEVIFVKLIHNAKSDDELASLLKC